jgi:hypothetical protein
MLITLLRKQTTILPLSEVKGDKIILKFSKSSRLRFQDFYSDMLLQKVWFVLQNVNFFNAQKNLRHLVFPQ